MKYTYFTDLKVFETPELNTYLDTIYSVVLKVFPPEQLPCVCGSVAKVMQGVYSENYIPKDIDLLVEDWQVFRYLTTELPFLFPNFTYEERKERFILYTDHLVIEFWRSFQKSNIALYKNLIKYIEYAY